MNNRKTRITVVLVCIFLVVISVLTLLEQLSTIPITRKIYDKKYISGLDTIGNLVPQNETLATNTNYPQVTYFTDHKVRLTKVDSESSLVRFMWNINSSYLLIAEDTLVSEPNRTPVLIQLVEKPIEKIFNYFYYNISAPKPKPSATLALHKIIEEKQFEELFEKIFEYKTEGSILHLYRLRPSITQNNLDIVTDNTRPMLIVSSPANWTIMESESNATRVHLMGTATDSGSNIKKVEVSVNGSKFRLADPRVPGDWSNWSLTHIFTSDGTKRIVARAIDNADNIRWFTFYIIIK